MSAALAWAWLATAHAHAPDTSFSTVTLHGAEAQIQLTLRARDAEALAARGEPGAAPPLTLIADGAPCPAADAAPLPSEPGQRRVGWAVRCPAAPTRLDARPLLDALPPHLHLTRVSVAGRDPADHALTPDQPQVEIGAPTAPGLVGAGLLHLVEGWDHVAFLALLALVPVRMSHLAWAVSGFTLGHAAALGLAAAGLVVPAPAGVEALIGWSLLALAAEAAWLPDRRGWAVPALASAAPLALALLPLGPPVPAAAGAALFSACHFALLARAQRPHRHRLRVAALLGVLHGFGLAGALLALELRGARLLTGLATFHLGVEAGQLLLLAVLVPLLAALRRWRPAGLLRWGTALGGALGAFAAVGRALG